MESLKKWKSESTEFKQDALKDAALGTFTLIILLYGVLFVADKLLAFVG